MPISLIPYGRLSDGKYGILVDNTTSKPIASVIEVHATLPSVADADNFDGRVVFVTTDAVLYVFSSTPSPTWIPLEGVPAEVDNVNGTPPTVPTPQLGGLFWDLDTEVLFLWDGSAWQPSGGRYAAQFVQQAYTGNGATTIYSLGVASAVTVEYVEVFLDGVRQMPTDAYSVVGTTIVFTDPVPSSVEILIRTLVSTAVAQSAQVYSAVYTASNGQTTFSVGVPGVDHASTFVFVDGVHQALNVDYTVDSVDTTIVSISKLDATTARATTTVAHGLAVSADITIGGAADALYNGAFTVSNIPSATQFDFTVSASAPSSATPDPILYFTPPQFNDSIVLTTPCSGGERIDIRSLRNVLVAPSAGEANTIASVGSGTSLAAGKSGTTLQVKSLVAGTNVTLNSNSSEITINATVALSAHDRVGINTANYIVNGTESYIGVRNTAAPVVIDLSPITADGVLNSGRAITIKDESGNASGNSITIQPGGGSTIDGNGSYIITTDFGCVRLVFDGAAYFIEFEKV